MTLLIFIPIDLSIFYIIILKWCSLVVDSSKLLALKKWDQQDGTVVEDTYHVSL